MKKQDKIEELENELKVKREELEVLGSNLDGILSECNVNEDLEVYSSKDEFVKYVEDNRLLNEECIYYNTAMEYLMENDNSLNESLNIATEFCYETQNLNSTILAGLLMTRKNEENFYDLDSDFDEYFDLKEEIESLESDLEELTEEV